jgi:isocitrate/isopropylmalate dehydrogenase
MGSLVLGVDTPGYSMPSTAVAAMAKAVFRQRPSLHRERLGGFPREHREDLLQHRKGLPLAGQRVAHPDNREVIATNNMFGDIVTDLKAAFRTI